MEGDLRVSKRTRMLLPALKLLAADEETAGSRVYRRVNSYADVRRWEECLCSDS